MPGLPSGSSTRDTAEARSPIVFLWDNFGPIHVDRCSAVAELFRGEREVVGLELFGASDVYGWSSESAATFRKATLFPDRNWHDTGQVTLARAIVRTCRTMGAGDIFLCHYERKGIFLAASLLKALGCRVYAMGCSKFDDYERDLRREFAKRAFYLPYTGGISSGKRARDYMRFLGLPSAKVHTEYNTLSVGRIRSLAGVEPAPGGTAFADRHFTMVARFVPKKNIAMAIDAYDLYRRQVPSPRAFHLIGSGPLEAELRKRVLDLGLSEHVIFRGFLQTDGVARALGTTLALLLPSIEEQFGNVVIEAQAMGLPVILSDNCGARDVLIRTAVNGFVIEPDNPRGLAYFLTQLTSSEALWREMSAAALSSAPRGDVRQFALATAKAVGRLPV